MCGSHVLSVFAMTNYSISLYLTTFEPKSINIHFNACTTFRWGGRHYADMVIELRDRRLWRYFRAYSHSIAQSLFVSFFHVRQITLEYLPNIHLEPYIHWNVCIKGWFMWQMWFKSNERFSERYFLRFGRNFTVFICAISVLFSFDIWLACNYCKKKEWISETELEGNRMFMIVIFTKISPQLPLLFTSIVRRTLFA